MKECIKIRRRGHLSHAVGKGGGIVDQIYKCYDEVKMTNRIKIAKKGYYRSRNILIGKIMDGIIFYRKKNEN